MYQQFDSGVVEQEGPQYSQSSESQTVQPLQEPVLQDGQGGESLREQTDLY